MSQGTAVFPGEFGIIKGAIVPTMQNSTGQDIIVSCENPDGSAFSVDGLTINAYFVDIKSQAEWVASGTIVGSGSTITWSPSAGDVGTPSEYLLYFVAENSGLIPSYGMEWAIKDVPFGTITPPESTVGIPPADLAWVQAARALNPTPATWATQTLFDADNLLFVDATLTEEGNVYNAVDDASTAAVVGDTVWVNDTQSLNLAKSGVTYYVASSGILSGGGGIEIPDNVGDEIVFIVDGAIVSSILMLAADKQKLRITGRGAVTLLSIVSGAYNDVHLIAANITEITATTTATMGTVSHTTIGTLDSDVTLTDSVTNIVGAISYGRIERLIDNPATLSASINLSYDVPHLTAADFVLAITADSPLTISSTGAIQGDSKTILVKNTDGANWDLTFSTGFGLISGTSPFTIVDGEGSLFTIYYYAITSKWLVMFVADGLKAAP